MPGERGHIETIDSVFKAITGPILLVSGIIITSSTGRTTEDYPIIKTKRSFKNKTSLK